MAVSQRPSDCAHIIPGPVPRRRLLFVSTRFLLPVDSGGKIRTTQILRGLKGGEFEVILTSPAPAQGVDSFAAQLAELCDRFVPWEPAPEGLTRHVRRWMALLSHLPVAVASDISRSGHTTVARELAQRPDIVVFDFPHAAVLAPANIPVPSVLFTHNIEAEIYARHVRVARNPLLRYVWHDQYAKMQRFEREALSLFDTVVAVSERDRRVFLEQYGAQGIELIPTGVDLEYFTYAAPADSETIVFIGSMDWPANIDGVSFLMQDVWPLVLQRRPAAQMCVVGRQPPPALEADARRRGYRWIFTGYVDDVRKFVHEAAVSVIPLRVGGGTRLKVYEAMAMGCPVVSTTIGVEGLPVEDRTHYRRADRAEDLATALVELLTDRAEAHAVAQRARRLVEERFGFQHAAREFERICRNTLAGKQGRH